MGSTQHADARRSTAATALRLRPGMVTRALAPVALAVAAVIAPGAIGAAPAAAAEVDARPDSGAVSIVGRGFGHGRGMSQWGAYGAATKGLQWPTILSFYYPGTRQVRLPATAMRVWISGDNDGVTTVKPDVGLSVSAAGGTQVLPSGNGFRAWRARGTGPTLEYLDASGAWRTHALPFNASGDLAFATSGGTVKVILPGGRLQELRGAVHASVSGSRVLTVLHSTMDSYLRSVVPNEMPSSWHVQALAAQSVAARTYAAAYRQRQRAKGSVWDICDTVTCQVFKGVATYNANGTGRSAKEDSRSSAAIAMTSDIVLRTGANNNSPLAYTEFSASNGGYTVSGGSSYLPAKPDPYDGVMKNPNSSWSRTIDVGTLERTWRLGRLVRIQINSRDGRGALGGRVRSLTLVGTSAVRTITGTQLRSALKLKSDWFTVVTKATLPRDWTGDGIADVMMRRADGTLALLAGKRNTLNAPVTAGSGWGGYTALVAAGQWDRTGGEDLIARTAQGDLVLFPRTSSGAFGRARVIGTGAAQYRSITGAGDFTGDGRVDLAAVDAQGRLLVLPQTTQLRIGKPVPIASLGGLTKVTAVGDFDNDRRADLAVIDAAGTMLLVRGNGRGASLGTRQFGRGWSSFLDVWSPGDLTGDGRADVLALKSNGVLYRYITGARTNLGSGRAISSGWTGVMPVR
ncbi:MAG: SpoIID/LytB domain-containing protein [Austwickia sp.]|nr:SpoIID/LytB domain-containing protein [Austwickia sp.]